MRSLKEYSVKDGLVFKNGAPVHTTKRTFGLLLPVLQELFGGSSLERQSDGTIGAEMPASVIQGFISDWLLHKCISWANRRKVEGWTCGATTGFTLSDGSVRSGDLMFLVDPPEEEDREQAFPNAIVTFVIEVVTLHKKVIEAKRKFQTSWFPNGTKLGWIVDCERGQVLERYLGNDDKLSRWYLDTMKGLKLDTADYLGEKWTCDFNELHKAIKKRFPNHW